MVCLPGSSPLGSSGSRPWPLRTALSQSRPLPSLRPGSRKPRSVASPGARLHPLEGPQPCPCPRPPVYAIRFQAAFSLYRSLVHLPASLGEKVLESGLKGVQRTVTPPGL